MAFLRVSFEGQQLGILSRELVSGALLSVLHSPSWRSPLRSAVSYESPSIRIPGRCNVRPESGERNTTMIASTGESRVTGTVESVHRTVSTHRAADCSCATFGVTVCVLCVAVHSVAHTTPEHSCLACSAAPRERVLVVRCCELRVRRTMTQHSCAASPPKTAYREFPGRKQRGGEKSDV